MEPDPLSAARRESRRRRRLGPDATCTRCREADRRALVLGDGPRLCYECAAQQAGRSPIERHHPAGRNNLEVTVPMPGNDHRILSDMQHDWPPGTLRNPDGSPLVEVAAAARGVLDLLRFIVERLLGLVPGFLEELDTYLRTSLGERWWEGFLAWRAERASGGVA